MININYLDIDNILLKEKWNENILIYDFACKAPYSIELLRIVLHKVKRYIKKHNGTKHFTLIDSENYGRIFDIFFKVVKK